MHLSLPAALDTFGGMKRPVIGITTDTAEKPDQYESPMAYAQSVQKAGGLPLLLAYGTDLSLIPQLVDLLDGVLFSGGNDLDPALYGEAYHPGAVPGDPARQRFELALIAEVEKRRMPALGICMGCQLMNVHRGGSLIQFLPDQPRQETLEHRKINNQWTHHPVRVEPQSLVARAVGKTDFQANSSHKQAVKKLGRGLQKIGLSPDGVIEGVEDPSLPLFLGVQWHPERLSDEPEHLALFKLLVEKASRRE
jgi:putative glutamine amidotransferase